MNEYGSKATKFHGGSAQEGGRRAIVLTGGGIMTSSAPANQALDICIQQALDDSVAACGACANQAPAGRLWMRSHGQRMLLLPPGHLV